MKNKIKKILNKIKNNKIRKNKIIAELIEQNLELKEKLTNAEENQDELLNQAAKYKKLHNDIHKKYSLYVIEKEKEISLKEKEIKKLQRENKKKKSETSNEKK